LSLPSALRQNPPLVTPHARAIQFRDDFRSAEPAPDPIFWNSQNDA
jgi:hypothetical protein